jgi:hypothetical protein
MNLIQFTEVDPNQHGRAMRTIAINPEHVVLLTGVTVGSHTYYTNITLLTGIQVSVSGSIEHVRKQLI